MKSENTFHLFWMLIKKFAIIQLALYLCLFVILSALANWQLKKYFLQESKEALQSQLTIVQYFFEKQQITSSTDVADLCQIKLKFPHMRITLLNANGDVLCDSDHQITDMSNHSNRPEIIQAKNRNGEKNVGYAERYSKTLSINMLYGAIATQFLNQQYFLRLAIPLKDIDSSVKFFSYGFFILVIPLLIFAPMIALWFTYKASEPTSIAFERLTNIKNKIIEYTKTHKDNSYHQGKATYHPDLHSSDNNIFNQSLPMPQRLKSILDQTEKDLDHKLNELIIENAKLNALMESTIDPIVAIDNQELIWFANKKFRSSFLANIEKSHQHSTQHSIQNSMTRLKIKEIFRQHLNINDAFIKALRLNANSVEKNISLPSLESNDHNQQILNFDLNITPIKNNHTNQIIGAMGVFHNITERILGEQMKENFICNISHQVRTPLSSLQGYFQLFKQEVDLTPELSSYANKIEHSLTRIVSLFDDLLKLSKIEIKTDLKYETVATLSLTEEVISLLSPIYKEKNIIINPQVRRGAENIRVDAMLLETLLINLIDNAYKYSGNNGSIDILWTRNLSSTILEVKDNGIGIHLEHQNKIFEKFYRVEADHSRDVDGTGLGLTIVKQIVLKHGGLIEVESSPGNGSIFRVIFPYSTTC